MTVALKIYGHNYEIGAPYTPTIKSQATYTSGLYKRTKLPQKVCKNHNYWECGGIRGANAKISFNLPSLFYMGALS